MNALFVSDPPALATSKKSRWANWLRNEVFDAQIAMPHTESDIVGVIRDARARAEQVRVVGSGHSSTPLHRSNGFVMSLDNMRGVVSGDTARSRGVMLAGTKIRELGAPLWDLGLSLTNQGEIDRQAIAGAIGTGTHGTGLGLRNISSALRAARIVTGTGEVVEVDESTPDELHAAQVAMGMLGVMTEIELQLSPAYQLTEWLGFVPFEAIFPHCLELAKSHRNFGILWLPTHQTAMDYDLVPPDGHPSMADAGDVCFTKIYDIGDVDAGPVAEYGQVRRVEPGYVIYPDHFEPEFWEMEYMLPVEPGLECLQELREIFLRDYPTKHTPIQLRFVAEDEAFLSQNNGRPSAVISVSTAPGKPVPGFFRRCDEVLTRYGGRPHWGKLHRTSPERLRDQFPDYDSFRQIRRQFDPDGIFLNEYLAPLFG